MNRTFILSPAQAGGQRALLLRRPHAPFELARRVQVGDATLGEVFSFCSGLYFRGKLTYAQRFAGGSAEWGGVQIITSSRGLLPPDTRLGLDELEEFAEIAVDASEPRFHSPLAISASALAAATDGEVVLLGSIATGKYVDILLPIFGERLLFPKEFVGRGDLSRGGLLLRCAAGGEELAYAPLAGAWRKGQRPPKLAALSPRRDPPGPEPGS